MPIFEYACEDCHHLFEKLVRNSETAITCPSCEGAQVKKRFSVFASITSGGPSFDGGFDCGAPEAGCGRCGMAEGSCMN